MAYSLNKNQAQSLCAAVRAAAARDDVRIAVECIYQQLQDAIELRRPICVTSGRCCRFEEFGHRLFVTTIELAVFSGAIELGGQSSRRGRSWDGTGCPYQIGGLCSVHTIRPFGCRVFFCDASSTEWQREQYERFHERLKRLHDELGVAYFYIEWRQALQAIREWRWRFFG